MRALGVAAGLAALLQAPGPARAHEALHEIDRGRAVAVRAAHADGAPMAGCPWRVFSPADANDPHQRGSTDRRGWLAFVPDVPGAWRVEVADAGGHGFSTVVEVGASAAHDHGTGAVSTLAFVLRPLAGLAAIGALFAILLAVHRRRSRRA
ncbi:MAG TPA: hypothetical protein VLS93_02530 [Anaeromyxobacteraceae bacterium]|nr:hypothetical protein [Anaeromyxobacteraceae bacterium]